jgi:hypothetical protein
MFLNTLLSALSSASLERDKSKSMKMKFGAGKELSLHGKDHMTAIFAPLDN